MGLNTLRLPFSLVLKQTFQDPYFEVANIRFVEKQTSIPVPRIRDVLPRTSNMPGVIVMDLIEGETLESWLVDRTQWPAEYFETQNRLMESDRSEKIGIAASIFRDERLNPDVDFSDAEPLFNDLRKALAELRFLPPPSPAISGLDGKALVWLREFRDSPRVLPPLAGVAAFHKKLLDMALRGVYASRAPHIMRLAKPVLEKHHRICFTHTDLNHGNIIVRNGRLAGLIDWEFSGWYPEYWEYTMLCFSVEKDRQVQMFWDAVGVFPGKYEEELALERALWLCTGEQSIRPGVVPDLYLDQSLEFDQ